LDELYLPKDCGFCKNNGVVNYLNTAYGQQSLNVAIEEYKLSQHTSWK